jgi:hypothetical protein
MKLLTPGGRISAALILGTLFSAGCSTLIKQSYQGDPQASQMKLSAYSGTTAIYGSTDPVADSRKLVSEEYARIGISTFRKDGRVTYAELQSQANDVGADIVLFSVKWTGSTQYLPPVALNADGAPYTLAPFAGENPAAAPPGAAAVSGQDYEYTLSFWRRAPNS